MSKSILNIVSIIREKSVEVAKINPNLVYKLLRDIGIRFPKIYKILAMYVPKYL